MASQLEGPNRMGLTVRRGLIVRRDFTVRKDFRVTMARSIVLTIRMCFFKQNSVVTQPYYMSVIVSLDRRHIRNQHRYSVGEGH